MSVEKPVPGGVEPVGNESLNAVAVLRDLAALARQNVTGKALRDAIVERALHLFKADAAAHWRLESRERLWRIAAASGLSQDYSSVSIPAPPSDNTARVLPGPVFIPDVNAWPLVDERRAMYKDEGIASFLVFPLQIRGETAGTICCYYRTPKRSISERELGIAAAFGEIASLALSTERFDQLADVARDVAGRLDLEAVVQRITDAATELTGAQFGAFFYNMIDANGESYTLYTISGVPRSLFEKFPMPRNTAVFAPTFAGSAIVRSANITRDPRYGQNSPYFGMPAGHLPVVSYLAVPVVSRGGEVLGGLFFGHSAEAVFGETEEKVAVALAGHAAVAIDNVRLYERLEQDRLVLRRDEHRYRSLVVATPSPQAMMIASRDGQLEEDTPSWRQITGQAAGEERGTGWLNAVHRDHREAVEAAWKTAIANSALFEQEYLLRQQDGSYRWFADKAVPITDDKGHVVEWVRTVTDVHEQHVAQEGLRFLARVNEIFASSLDYRETLKNVTFLAVPRIADWAAVDIIDATGDRRYERLAVAHIDPAKRVLAEEFQRRYPPDPETDAIQRVISTGKSELVADIPDELLQQAARSPEHLQMMRDLGLMSYIIVPLRSRGEVIGAVTFVASDRRFTQQDLSHAEELANRASVAIENARLYGAAQAANRAKDEFLATLSHELRTPMTAVLGWARMLKLGLSESEAKVAIDAIEQSATAQAQLIEDVLDASRIMTGKLTFDPRPTDLAVVAQAALTTIHPAAAARNIEILTSIPPALPPISGDEARLQQIIWNLLANAIKFTPRGGSVTLKIVQAGSVLQLTVTDTGEGIEREFLPYVFEPFRQADSSSTREHGGIGLGLAIVRSLVELHGGRISAASPGKGRGATFTLELPVMESAPSLSGKPKSETPVLAPASAVLPSLTGLLLLVIDDQEFARDVVAAILRRCGATVRTASSVQEGLQRFRDGQPHVVVCDIAMPQEDGYVFLEAIRRMKDARSTTPILALTAFGRPEDRLHALNAGFDAYLKKPVDPAELATAVQRLASGR